MAGIDGRSEQSILAEFSEKRSRLQNTWNKVTELSADSTEHEVVIAALKPMDPTRRCFRLVGEVLVEGTVGETLPAVIKNMAGMDSAIANLQAMLTSQKNDLAEYQTKYKIKIRETDQVDDDEEAEDVPKGGPKAPANKAGSSGNAGQGVLVKGQ